MTKHKLTQWSKLCTAICGIYWCLLGLINVKLHICDFLTERFHEHMCKDNDFRNYAAVTMTPFNNSLMDQKKLIFQIKK